MMNEECRIFRSGGGFSTGGVSVWSERYRALITGGRRATSAARIATTAASEWADANPLTSSGIRRHSLTGALFVGLSHSPDFLQQLFSTLGNIKNCGQETHPPHSNVKERRID